MSRSTAAHQAWRDPHLPQLSPWTSWKSWDTLAVDLLNIPKEVNTHDIYDGFGKEGNIMHIDLWENLKGEPDSKGRIRFRSAFSSDPMLCMKPTTDCQQTTTRESFLGQWPLSHQTPERGLL
jgi:hypothetical protein